MPSPSKLDGQKPTGLLEVDSSGNYYQLLVRIYGGRRFSPSEEGAKAILLECRCDVASLSPSVQEFPFLALHSRPVFKNFTLLHSPFSLFALSPCLHSVSLSVSLALLSSILPPHFPHELLRQHFSLLCLNFETPSTDPVRFESSTNFQRSRYGSSGKLPRCSVHESLTCHLIPSSFNAETLSTDPVPLVSSPTFNTELVWEFGAERYKALSAQDGSTVRKTSLNVLLFLERWADV